LPSAAASTKIFVEGDSGAAFTTEGHNAGGTKLIQFLSGFGNDANISRVVLYDASS